MNKNKFVQYILYLISNKRHGSINTAYAIGVGMIKSFQNKLRLLVQNIIRNKMLSLGWMRKISILLHYLKKMKKIFTIMKDYIKYFRNKLVFSLENTTRRISLSIKICKYKIKRKTLLLHKNMVTLYSTLTFYIKTFTINRLYSAANQIRYSIISQTQLFYINLVTFSIKLKNKFCNIYCIRILRILFLLIRNKFNRMMQRIRIILVRKFEYYTGLPYKTLALSVYLNVFFLILIKIIVLFCFDIRLPFYVNLIFYFIFLLINLKFSLHIFFFIRNAYVWMLKRLLGKFYWFTDLWDQLLSDNPVARIYPDFIIVKLRTIRINNQNIINKVVRFIFCLFCQFELLRLSRPKFFFLFNVGLHYCLIFNAAFYMSLLLSFIFFISRLNLLLSDIYMSNFQENIRQIEHIGRNEYIGATFKNAVILSLWVIRSFEIRDYEKDFREEENNEIKLLPDTFLMVFYPKFMNINFTRDKMRIFQGYQDLYQKRRNSRYDPEKYKNKIHIFQISKKKKKIKNNKYIRVKILPIIAVLPVKFKIKEIPTLVSGNPTLQNWKHFNFLEFYRFQQHIPPHLKNIFFKDMKRHPGAFRFNGQLENGSYEYHRINFSSLPIIKNNYNYNYPYLTYLGNHWIPQYDNRIVLYYQRIEVDKKTHDDITNYIDNNKYIDTFQTNMEHDFILNIYEKNPNCIYGEKMKLLVPVITQNSTLFLPDLFFKSLLITEVLNSNYSQIDMSFQYSLSIMDKLILSNNVEKAQLNYLIQFKQRVTASYLEFVYLNRNNSNLRLAPESLEVKNLLTFQKNLDAAFNPATSPTGIPNSAFLDLLSYFPVSPRFIENQKQFESKNFSENDFIAFCHNPNMYNDLQKNQRTFHDPKKVIGNWTSNNSVKKTPTDPDNDIEA